MSGNRQISNELDSIIEGMQEIGYQVTTYRSRCKGDITRYITKNITELDTQLILISGGDGSINECVTGMMQKGIDIPLGILPMGTANDLAMELGISGSTQEMLEHIKNGIPKPIDIGRINEQYLINIGALGLFSGVSHTLDLEIKRKFGKIAYYYEALKQVKKFQPISLQLEYGGQVIKGKYTLILILNGTGAGELKNLVENGSLEDGLLDILCIKEIPVLKVPELFLKIVNADYQNNEYIDYIQTSAMHISSLDICHENIDIDGEVGPKLPVQIQSISGAIRVLVKAE